jgi:hypothetical protein
MVRAVATSMAALVPCSSTPPPPVDPGFAVGAFGAPFAPAPSRSELPLLMELLLPPLLLLVSVLGLRCLLPPLRRRFLLLRWAGLRLPPLPLPQLLLLLLCASCRTCDCRPLLPGCGKPASSACLAAAAPPPPPPRRASSRHPALSRCCCCCSCRLRSSRSRCCCCCCCCCCRDLSSCSTAAAAIPFCWCGCLLGSDGGGAVLPAPALACTALRYAGA